MKETVTDHIVEFFEWYVLYDISMNGLQFDFQSQSIILVINDCDREGEDVELRLIFKKITKYTFEYPVDRFFYEMKAIYRVKLLLAQENYYELEVLIDMERIADGVEFTVGKMLIGFADLEVIGGLSREAMEYKWKKEE